jgi:hypothetical protein
LGSYFLRVSHMDSVTTRFLNAVPPAEHVATFHWLFDGVNLGESKSIERSYYLAILQEAAGQHDDALANYRLVLSKLPTHSGSMGDAAEAAIKRLSH